MLSVMKSYLFVHVAQGITKGEGLREDSFSSSRRSKCKWSVRSRRANTHLAVLLGSLSESPYSNTKRTNVVLFLESLWTGNFNS